MCRAMRVAGIPVSHKRVARLMSEAGVRARAAKRRLRNPAIKSMFFTTPNRVANLEADRIDRIWTGDITYIKVQQRWRYLALAA